MKQQTALLLLLCAAFLHCTKLEAQTVYFTQPETVSKVNATGTGYQPLFHAANQITYITLDRAASRIYVADGTDIRRSNYDGSAVQTVVSPNAFIAGVQVDHTAGTIYWSEWQNNKIYRSNLDGTNKTTILNVPNPRGFRLDPINQQIYWAEFDTHKIRRANLDGTNMVDIANTSLNPFDLALDLVNSKVYWAEGAEGHYGDVSRAGLDGSGITAIATQLGQSSTVDVDPIGGKVYFVDGFAGKVLRANLNGTSRQDVVTVSGIPQHLVVDVPLAFVPEPNSLLWLAFGPLLISRRRAR